MKKKVLILNPPWVKDFCRSARWAARSRARVQRHPDSLLIAAAVLEEAGCEVKFIDGPALDYSEQNVIDIAKKFVPDFLIVHTTTPSIYNDLSYCKKIKNIFPKIVTVAIGSHVSAEIKDSFAISKEKFNLSLDIIAKGEYDLSLRSIVLEEELTSINGISWKKGNEIINNPIKGNVDVNKLPFPAWHLTDPKLYKDFGKLYPFLTLISGRGCTGKCTFCRDMQVMEGGGFRLRNATNVVDEIQDDINKYPYIKEIMFETDTFTASANYVKEICNDIIERGLNKKLSFSCNTRVDMNLDLLPLMKKAGFRMLMTGFEFGTQEALDSVKKGIKLEQSRAFAKEAKRLGFTIHGCFMFGAPNETLESGNKTIEFANSLPCDTVQFSGICVYPGTEMYHWAKENKFLVPTRWEEWVSDSYEQVTLLNYPQLSQKQIDSLIDKGLKSFYLRPIQILRMIIAIRTLDDIKRKLSGFSGFLDYFKKAKK